LVDPAQVEQEIAVQNMLLARTPDIPESVRFFVEGLADDVANMPSEAALRIDPYLLVALQRALIASLRALENTDAEGARRELRIRLEQLRQVYRDLADARPIYEDQHPKQLVHWLVDVLDVPQARLAGLFGVSARTFQRWASETDESAPIGDDARHVRLVSSVASHLRHALTGQGVVDWFERPHPAAGNRPPRELLDEPAAFALLTHLAASTRSSIAA
jgi:uncharacterized protein (DUF2384 family)